MWLNLPAAHAFPFYELKRIQLDNLFILGHEDPLIAKVCIPFHPPCCSTPPPPAPLHPPYQALQLRELEPVFVLDEGMHHGHLIVNVNSQAVAVNKQPGASGRGLGAQSLKHGPHGFGWWMRVHE